MSQRGLVPDKRDHASECKDSMTPVDYAKSIELFARQAIGTSLYPGQMFEDLASFLSRELDQSNLYRNDQLKIDVIAHTLSPLVEKQIYRCLDTRELTVLEDKLSLGNSRPDHNNRKCAMVFLRGHQPPQCLNCIGAMFKIDPLFFQQHLEYRWSSRPLKLFATPLLPSASLNTIRLLFITLGENRNNGSVSSGNQVHALRLKAENDMATYLHDVAREYMLETGNSIVRRFNIHNAQYFSIEQETTISMQVLGDKWSAVIWTDAAKDLGSGPEGPWHSARSKSICQSSPFLPSIRHFPHQAFIRPLDLTLPEVRQARGFFRQSVCLIAQNYGSTMDHTLMALDPLYALSELFQGSADSISQLLNLVECVIDKGTGYNLYKSQDYSLANLSYHQDILNRLESRLLESIFDLQRHQNSSWPRSTNEAQNTKSIATIDALLEDFRTLLSRVQHLLVRCQSGMTICMNSAAIAESQKAIDQAKRVEQLTRLAFFYIPLSFTTSFFGMNLKSFGTTGGLQLWVFFATSIPLVFISYVVLGWLN